MNLYHADVQQRCVDLGLTTNEKIRRREKLFKICCLPVYITYVLVCVYAVNGARGFACGFWQLFVILSIMNLIDRFLIDGWWVGHTKAWTIPGTEDMKPYINKSDKRTKWMGHIRNESPEEIAYARDMFETIFKDYKQEKDVHISGLLANMMNQTPVTADDFSQLKGRILLVLPDQDFFSGKMQEDLINLMHDPKIAYVSCGHLSTVLRVDDYIGVI